MTIRIDGTNTAANPGITGADADTGLSFGTNEVSLNTAGTERFRIGSAGQFGIGGATYGTSGQALISGGASAAPQWATVASSGNTSTSLSTSSSSTTLDGISNSANIITIGFNNIRVATNDFLAVQLRSGGSNVTGSFYNYASKQNTSSSGIGAATIYFVVLENGWASNTDRLDGTFTLVRSASNTWVASWSAVTRSNANGFTGGGDYGSATANLNGIRLLSGANFVGGSFSLTWS